MFNLIETRIIWTMRAPDC